MRRASLLSRLALALLALTGFVAPLSAMEVDRVVQTTGGKPSAHQTQEHHRGAPRLREVPRLSRAPRFTSRHDEVARRYLMNRAWLL